MRQWFEFVVKAVPIEMAAYWLIIIYKMYTVIVGTYLITYRTA